MFTSRRLDDKLTALLIAAWSFVLCVASVDTFCGRVAVPTAVARAQQAQAQVAARPASAAVKVALAH